MPHAAGRTSLLDRFPALDDPRQSRKTLYPLDEVLLLCVCATTGGADGFVEMSDRGKARLDFLRRFLPFEAGIPSHDTLNDVAVSLDRKLFEDRFADRTETLHDGDESFVPVARADGGGGHGDAPGAIVLGAGGAYKTGGFMGEWRLQRVSGDERLRNGPSKHGRRTTAAE